LSVAPDALIRTQKSLEDVEGIVFNIQRFSLQDGPGIRTTVFLKGCPLHCLWCSNPESQNFRPEIAHRDTLCTKCGLCVNACPEEAISIDDKGIYIDRKKCTNCGDCISVCTPGVLKILGETMSAGDVFQEIRKDEDFYRVSGGGVTASGGEPLVQPDFVAALFRLCQDYGIDTCIETEEVLRNLRIAVASGTPVTIRVPLIPGINDSDEELNEIAHIAIDSLKEPKKVELLPYHRFGIGKYQQLDREYELTELRAPEEPQIQRFKELFESFGLECEVVL